MTAPAPKPISPRWGSTTKTVIGITIAALILALLIYFRSIIGPLILAFILTYLLHPLAKRLSNAAHLGWRPAVNIVYIIYLVVLVGLSTLTGLALVQQAQSLIRVVERFLTDLPGLLDQLSTQVFQIGPFTINPGQYTDLSTLGDQLIANLQGLVGRAGTLVSTLATATVTTLGWGLFILAVSYFILADLGKVPDPLTVLDIPGYADDIRRMGRELGRIWNAFLRGQITIVILVMIASTTLLSILGVRYSFAIGILVGLARFVPYVGPLFTNLVTALVTFFQPENHFGMQPLSYMILVLVLAFILDQLFDNLISPRLLGQSLGVHPAAVLVVAIIVTNLIGLIGLVLAAPVLATLRLVGRYTLRKMFDQNPWPAPEGELKAVEIPLLGRLFRRIRLWYTLRKQS